LRLDLLQALGLLLDLATKAGALVDEVERARGVHANVDGDGLDGLDGVVLAHVDHLTLLSERSELLCSSNQSIEKVSTSPGSQFSSVDARTRHFTRHRAVASLRFRKPLHYPAVLRGPGGPGKIRTCIYSIWNREFCHLNYRPWI